MKENVIKTITIPETLVNQRLDLALSQLLPEYSRAVIQRWMKQGLVTCHEQPLKPKQLAELGQVITVTIVTETVTTWSAEALPLETVFVDEHCLVVNKSANCVVHPAAGHHDGTLVNALLHHYPDLAALPRAGIVHRLDKDTTGLMVVARTLTAHNSLVQQLQARTISRIYLAIANGQLATTQGHVTTQMGRHPYNRQKMAVLEWGGKVATTHYQVIERFRNHSYLQLKLETGRTHQIRVHMAHLKHPLAGDQTYCPQTIIPKGCASALKSYLQHFSRQALHATMLAFQHPVTQERLSFQAPLPADMQQLLELLREDTG